MPEMTPEELTRFFREAPLESLKIGGVVETEDTRYLGAVGLSLTQPLFSSILGFNFSGVLSDTARFWTQPLREDEEGVEGLAAIFRQFDSSKYQATPEDLPAGWVPPEDSLKLESWVADMNRHLQKLLLLKAR
jgi:hypothetical protein